MRLNRFIFCLIGCVLASAHLAEAQPNTNWAYRIEVQSNRTEGKVYLSYSVAGVGTLDSVILSQGTGTLAGKLPQPVVATMTTKDRSQGQLTVVLHSGITQVRADAKLTLSDIDSVQRDYAKLTQIDGVRRSYFPLYGELNQRQDTAGLRRLGLVFDSLRTVDLATARAYVASHPNSPLASIAFMRFATFTNDYTTLEPEFQQAPEWVRLTPEGRAIAEKIEGAKGIGVGSPAKEFTQATAAGLPIRLSDYRGKVILLDFWASWCAPCRKLHPDLIALYQKYKPEGFEIISVSLDESRDDWVAAAAKDGLTWAGTSDLKGQNNSVALLYGVQAIPSNFLIDRGGVVVGKNLTKAALESQLVATLKQRK